MASSRTYLPLPSIGRVQPNTHVFWVDAQEVGNTYGFHAFCPSGRRILDDQAYPVTYYQDKWYYLQHSNKQGLPYLGEELPHISQYDYVPQEQEVQEDLLTPTVDQRTFESIAAQVAEEATQTTLTSEDEQESNQGQASRPESTDTFEEDPRPTEQERPITIAMATQTMTQTTQQTRAQTPPLPITTTATPQDTYNKLLTVFNR
jgi:hypothetical protein